MDTVANQKDIQQLKNIRKKLYFIWLLSGLLGGHRFTISRFSSGFIQLVLFTVGLLLILNLQEPGFWLLVICFFWWMIDATLIPDLLEKYSPLYIEIFRRTGSVRPESQKNNDKRIFGYFEVVTFLLMFLFVWIGADGEEPTTSGAFVMIILFVAALIYGTIIHIIDERKRQSKEGLVDKR